MTTQRADLLAAFNAEMQPGRFKDYGPNGLQVEGRAEIRKLVRLSPLDAQWLLPELIEDSPALWMLSWNGFIVDARDLPPEIRREAAGMGLIPDAPAMKEAADGEETAHPKKEPAAQNPPRVNASAPNASHTSENPEPSSAPDRKASA